jgi:hypothetical protein
MEKCSDCAGRGRSRKVCTQYVPPSNWFAEAEEFAAAWETGVPLDKAGDLGFELQAEKVTRVRAVQKTTLVVAWDRNLLKSTCMIAPQITFS